MLVAASAVACANGPAKVDIRGNVVAFYPYADATLVAANGNVVVRAGNLRIRARAVQYDVRRGRLIAAGDVEARDGARITTGEGYALDLTTGNAIILRVAPVPATFAVAADATAPDVAAPALPETFRGLDLDGRRPYIRSRHAIVVPDASVRMTPAAFPTGAGRAVALPTFLYSLVRNQNIAQTTGPGASFDQPYNLFGSANSLTAAHLRYESQNGVSLGVDTRVVDGTRAYAVTSVLPFRDKRIDALAFQQLRPGVQQTFSASHTFGAYDFNALAYRFQATGRVATATLSTSLFDSTNSAELALSTLSHDVGHYFSYQLRAGYGYDHYLGGYPFANDFRTFAGGNVATPSATVAHTDLSARYDYGITSYDFPHELASGTLTLTAARDLGRGVQAYASVAFAQIDDRYRDVAVGRVALGLPDPRFPLLTPDGTPYVGYFAFAGIDTYRTYQLTTTFRGRGENRIALSLVRTRDFPQFDGYGRPPLQASIDITERIAPTIRLEIGRAYTFGWAGRYLSPQYTFGISP